MVEAPPGGPVVERPGGAHVAPRCHVPLAETTGEVTTGTGSGITGNGDIGNQGIHQMDVARWALGKSALSPRILSVGGRFGYVDDGETPNTQFAVHDYGDALLIFEVRGLPSGAPEPTAAQEKGEKVREEMDKYRGQSVGHVIECENGYLAGTTVYDNDGKEIRNFSARGEGDHFANFIKAVRSRKVSDLKSAPPRPGPRRCGRRHPDLRYDQRQDLSRNLHGPLQSLSASPRGGRPDAADLVHGQHQGRRDGRRASIGISIRRGCIEISGSAGRASR